MDELTLLSEFGFTKYESRLINSLLTLGEASVRELVRHSKVPKNKAYEVLNKLQEKNIIAEIPITPRRYKIPNIDAFSSIVERKREEFDELSKSLQIFKNRLASPQKEFRDFFTVIKGRKHIQQQLAHQTGKTNYELLSIHGLSKYLPKNMQTINEAIKRGVEVKFIAPLTKENLKNMKKWKETGCQIRIYDKKKFGEAMPRFTIYDKKSVRITVGSPEVSNGEEYISMFTDSITLSNMFRNYFLVMWNQLKEFK